MREILRLFPGGVNLALQGFDDLILILQLPSEIFHSALGRPLETLSMLLSLPELALETDDFLELLVILGFEVFRS